MIKRDKENSEILLKLWSLLDENSVHNARIFDRILEGPNFRDIAQIVSYSEKNRLLYLHLIIHSNNQQPDYET